MPSALPVTAGHCLPPTKGHQPAEGRQRCHARAEGKRPVSSHYVGEQPERENGTVAMAGKRRSSSGNINRGEEGEGGKER